MGMAMSGFLRKLMGEKRMSILMVGLDSAGKTTILNKINIGEVVSTIPTIGFNVEELEYKKIKFTMWDVSGEAKMRPLWRNYYKEQHGIIFVVDSNDHERLDEAKDELMKMLAEDELKDAVLLVLANKQDMSNALTVKDITDKLGLQSLENRKWQIQGTKALSGDGLYEGLEWLSHNFEQ